jgi:hypothetical protein
MTLADYTGDGVLDLGMLWEASGDPTTTHARLYPSMLLSNQTDVEFQGTGYQLWRLDPARPPVLGIAGGPKWSWLNGTYVNQVAPSSNDPYAVALDVDGSGRDSLIELGARRAAVTVMNDDGTLRLIESSCAAGVNNDYMVLDVPPYDGRLDVYYSSRACILGADLTFQDQPTDYRLAIVDENGVAVDNWAWITTRDMDGDGAPDLLIQTSDGVHVARAEVEQR